MIKTLIIGLDLSFSSTGICISYLEDKVGIAMQFHRIVFDDETNKKKQYQPVAIQNIQQQTYRMPTNIHVEDLVIDDENRNNQEQMTATLKAMICSKKIGGVIAKCLDTYKPRELVICIENYIMPAFSGSNQLKTVSGLIMLQGFVRELIIRLGISYQYDFKIMTPTPSNNKLFFTGNGNADKALMLEWFLNHYEGKKLLPEANIDKLGRINDIIDSFALCMQGYSEYIKLSEFNKKL